MNLTTKDNVVSVVVRTCSPKRIFLFEKAISSISSNNFRPIELVVVAQTEDQEFIRDLKQRLAKHKKPDFDVILVINPTSRDERAKNLNLGLQEATGRYICFLDEDDIFYENFIPTLLKSLTESENTAWVYGDVALASCYIDEINEPRKRKIEFPFKRMSFSLDEFFQGNFIPINSYLLDRTRIDPEFLRFDESYTLAEDYVFLLKIATRYVPQYVEEVVSEYRVFDDLSNSTVIMNDQLGLHDTSKIKAWSYALWQVELLKESLRPGYSSGVFSLKTRKYIFYRLPRLKIFLQYRFPRIRRSLIGFAKMLRLVSQ